MKIVLVSCVKSKAETPTKAKELYISPLFKKNWAYAEALKPDKIYILSAEHGLLDPETVIAPYNKTLLAMSTRERQFWSSKVFKQLKENTDIINDTFVFLAGVTYREFLVPLLKHVETPLEGLGIGRQMHQLDAWLTQETEKD